jgi:hypothetical protein
MSDQSAQWKKTAVLALIAAVVSALSVITGLARGLQGHVMHMRILAAVGFAFTSAAAFSKARSDA